MSKEMKMGTKPEQTQETTKQQSSESKSKVMAMLKDQGLSPEELPMFQTPSSLGWKARKNNRGQITVYAPASR